jgi:thiol-disulfide isomerase/thioredoxin
MIWRRIITLLSAGLFALQSVAAQEPDSSAMSALYAKLQEYTDAIETEPVSVKENEASFLISSCEDSLVRQSVAIWLYDRYMNSKLMGDEAVAIYLVDEWFSKGKVSFRNNVDFLNARIFADFNRQSLIGLKAPELKLKGIDGGDVVFPPSSGRYSVIYFYAPDCADCKVESILLRNVLKDKDFPIDLYFVCTGDDKDQMESFISTYLKFDLPSANVVYCWDPNLDSDFQRKYGVLQTPAIFLVDPEGVIAGRKLDSAALGKLLQSVFAEQVYGSDESVDLFDQVFGLLSAVPADDSASSVTSAGSDSIVPAPLPTAEDVMMVADKADSLLVTNLPAGRQMEGDLLYYLLTKTGEGYRAGLRHLVDSLILGRPDVWNSADDSLKVVGLASLEHDLLSRADVGTAMPKIKVPGTLRTVKGSRSGRFSLRRPGIAFIMFYTDGCPNCEAEMAGIDKLFAHIRNKAAARKAKVLLVDMDAVSASDPELEKLLLDTFDLTSLPYITQTSRGIVTRKYLTFTGL